MQTEMIEKVILEAVESVIGSVPKSPDDNLITLAAEHGGGIADLIYIFDILENILKIPAAKVVVKRNYSVLSVREMAKAIEEDFGEIQVM